MHVRLRWPMRPVQAIIHAVSSDAEFLHQVIRKYRHDRVLWRVKWFVQNFYEHLAQGQDVDVKALQDLRRVHEQCAEVPIRRRRVQDFLGPRPGVERRLRHGRAVIAHPPAAPAPPRIDSSSEHRSPWRGPHIHMDVRHVAAEFVARKAPFPQFSTPFSLLVPPAPSTDARKTCPLTQTTSGIHVLTARWALRSPRHLQDRRPPPMHQHGPPPEPQVCWRLS